MVCTTSQKFMVRRICRAIGAGAVLALVSAGAWPQSPSSPMPSPLANTTHSTLGLKAIFESAWLRQPEAKSFTARTDAANARREDVNRWTPEPAAFEFSSKADGPGRSQGGREFSAGIAIPLWLPNERARSGALADAESLGVGARYAAARIRTAAAVREAYWSWERARVELALARDRLAAARTLAQDVARRVKAGNLARADQHQADGNVAAALGAEAESDGALIAATMQVRALAGNLPLPAPANTAIRAEAMPVLPQNLGPLDSSHPLVAEQVARSEVAKRTVELTRVRTRASPEVTLTTARARDASGDAYQPSIMLGIRLPFSSDTRQRAKLTAAHADAVEIESELLLARERVLADIESSRQRVESARVQAEAAQQRARLARETTVFFEKSFRMGESDLPTRLRVELEAVESDRQAARAQINHAASVSALRQALGLLPE